jgi:hypothetical protein
MLPFLKPKKQAGVMIATVKPDGEMKTKDASHAPELMGIAEDLISAVSMKDAGAVADALEAAFLFLESQPHEEGENAAD